MNGIVNSKLEPTVDVFLRGRSGETQVTAILDTGYNDFLSLPFSIVSILGLTRTDLQSVTFAHGSHRMSSLYKVEVEWDGEYKLVQVLGLAGDPLIGTELLKGYKLEADFVAGGPVQINRL